MPIENKTQYRLTKHWAKQFAMRLKFEEDRSPPATERTKAEQARIDSVASMLEDLNEQIVTYDKSTPPLTN